MLRFRTLRNYVRHVAQSARLRLGSGQTVIDIGPGHKPLLRADVLCDLPPSYGGQRPVAGIYTPPGRFVVGSVQHLPFREGAFDFAYCRALLEHVPDPAGACREIARIARRGLIIVPTWLWETMGGSPMHLWMISREDDGLLFRRKRVRDAELANRIPQDIRNSRAYAELFEAFYDRYYIEHFWEGEIRVRVEDRVDDPYVFEDKEPPLQAEAFRNPFRQPAGLRRKLKVWLFESLRACLGGRNVDLDSRTACPICKEGFSERAETALACGRCRVRFPVVDGVPFLIPECASPAAAHAAEGS